MIEISAKRERFCQEYVKDHNAARAARAAGYSEETAKSQGSRLLTFVDVEIRVIELEADITAALKITQERVVNELAKLAFVNILDVIALPGGYFSVKSLDDIPKEAQSAIQEVSETQHGLKIKMYDKKAALDSLARYLGMYTDKTQISGPNGGPVETSFKIDFVGMRNDNSDT
jgi:phage terminase small subunit